MRYLLLALLTIGVTSVSYSRADTIEDQQYENDLQELRAQGPSVYFDCNLNYQNYQGSSLSCQNNILNDFFTLNPDIAKKDTPDGSLVQIKLWDSQTDSNTTIVHVSWTSTASLSVDSGTRNFQFTDESISLREALLQSFLTGVMGGHLKVLSAQDKAGKVTVTYDASGNGSSGNTKKAYTGPFYADFSLSGAASQSGIGAVNADGTKPGISSSVNGSVSGALNYSTTKIRLVLNGYDSSTSNQTPDGMGGEIKSENDGSGVNFLSVYSFGSAKSQKPKRWAMMVLVSDNRSISSNIKGEQSVSGNVEYDLVPFQTDQKLALSGLLGVTENNLNLVAPNGLGNLREVYMSAGAQININYLFDQNKVAVSVATAGSKNLKYHGYNSYAAAASFSYQITSVVRFSTAGSYSYLTKSITFPGAPNYSNSNQTQDFGGSSGQGFSVNVIVGVTLWNGDKFRSDRRGGSIATQY